MLTPDEVRVLGVLVEKALTTPAQYPLSLNAVVVGCSQKNNRAPVAEYSEARVYDALDGLKAKGLAREAMLSGSRVAKFRQVGLEALKVSLPELVLLTELMLRGPQTVGELRGNASRMHAFDSLEACQQVLEGLVRRGPEAGGLIAGPLVRELPPPPGSRARLFAQLLCPEAHPTAAAPHAVGAEVPQPAAPRGSSELAMLLSKVAELEQRVTRLEARSGA
jgi:hypothetical protein